jgi:hypothetical protein
MKTEKEQNSEALKTLKAELMKIENAMQDCLYDYGGVVQSKKYVYKVLVEQAEAMRHSIKWFESLYSGD